MNVYLIIAFVILGIFGLAGVITFIKGIRKIDSYLEEWNKRNKQ